MTTVYTFKAITQIVWAQKSLWKSCGILLFPGTSKTFVHNEVYTIYIKLHNLCIK